MPHALTSSACPVMSAACPGVAAAKYASEMGASDTVKHELGSSTHTSSKAFFVVSHANYVHPREAVVVTYFQNSLRDELKQLFPVADVDGKPGYRRVVYNLCRGSKKQKQQVLNKYLADVRQARDGGTMPPPVLLAQANVFCTGVDGLQVRRCHQVTCPLSSGTLLMHATCVCRPLCCKLLPQPYMCCPADGHAWLSHRAVHLHALHCCCSWRVST